MEELGTFRKQFAAQIKRNVDSFNSAKKELTELISQRELLIDKQLDILRLKIKELDLFEEEFASKVGMHIDKVVEAKKGGKTEKRGKRSEPLRYVSNGLSLDGVSEEYEGNCYCHWQGGFR